MNIAIKIKELRESVGMTRKEFAEYTGIPIRTLEDWEAEKIGRASCRERV